jgi:hypothetical protein
MVLRKTVCLRRLGGHRRGEERAGRFFANRKVTAAKIVEGWSMLTGAACAGRHVLAIQDTTEVKFPTTAQRRRGLGPVKHGNTYGVLVHAMIAVDASTTACLGLVGGEVWTRPGVVTEHHRDRPLIERESRRWLATAERAKQVLQPAAMITVVADREGDIYPTWACLPPAGVHLLTRAMVDRRLVGGGTLFAAAAGFAVAGRRQIELPARQPDRAKRTAIVALRFGEVEIYRPRDEQDRTLAATVRLRLVDVCEVDPPEGAEPLHWRLVSTHEITDAAHAWQVVGWYQARWIIEQLFRVMKSQGCNWRIANSPPANAWSSWPPPRPRQHVSICSWCRNATARISCRPRLSSPSRRSKPSQRSARPSKAAPNGNKTSTRSQASPGRLGSSPGWAAGTAIIKPRKIVAIQAHA